MPHHTSLIAMLVAGFVLAFILGALAHRLRLSPLVGYLAAGIVAGPFTPGFVGDAEIAPQLAEIGVILLMFGVGEHYSLRDLLAVRKIALPGAVVQRAAAPVLGWGLAMLMGWSHVAGLVFGFSLATASTVVLLRAMEERRLLETRRGKIAVGWLIVEDLACVLALVLIPALALPSPIAPARLGISTSATTQARSSTISQPTAILPRRVSSRRRSSIARSRTTVEAVASEKPKTRPATWPQPIIIARPQPSTVATAICATAPGMAMFFTDIRSRSEKCRPTPNISRITPISASCGAISASPTKPGVNGPATIPAIR